MADGTVTRGELVILDSLRAQLGISDKDHGKIIGESPLLITCDQRQRSLRKDALRGLDQPSNVATLVTGAKADPKARGADWNRRRSNCSNEQAVGEQLAA